MQNVASARLFYNLVNGKFRLPCVKGAVKIYDFDWGIVSNINILQPLRFVSDKTPPLTQGRLSGAQINYNLSLWLSRIVGEGLCALPKILNAKCKMQNVASATRLYNVTIDFMRLFVGTGVLDRPQNLYKTNGSSRTPSPTTVKLISTINYNLLQMLCICNRYKSLTGFSICTLYSICAWRHENKGFVSYRVYASKHIEFEQRENISILRSRNIDKNLR